MKRTILVLLLLIAVRAEALGICQGDPLDDPANCEYTAQCRALHGEDDPACLQLSWSFTTYEILSEGYEQLLADRRVLTERVTALQTKIKRLRRRVRNLQEAE